MRSKATRCRSGAQISVYALNPCALSVGLNCGSLSSAFGRGAHCRSPDKRPSGFVF